MDLIDMFLGFAVLLLGRRLFWLFVGAAGFVAGAVLASEFLPAESELVRMGIATGAGLAGALIAMLVHRLAVAGAGFAVGGFVGVSLLSLFGVESEGMAVGVFLGGGFLGGLFVALLYDWALVILSSLLGATLIVHTVKFGPVASAVFFSVLTLTGIAFQRGMWTTSPEKERG